MRLLVSMVAVFLIASAATVYGQRGGRGAAAPAAAREAAALDLTGYRAREVATEVRSVPVAGLVEAMLAGRVAEFLDARRDHYVITVRR